MARILLIDDDDTILLQVGKILKTAKHEVDAVNNATDGIKRLEETEYDIIITDLKMPKVSGLDFLRSAKFMPKTEKSTFIVLSSHSESAEVRSALQLGIREYIIKPIKPDMFMDKIETLILQRQFE